MIKELKNMKVVYFLSLYIHTHTYIYRYIYIYTERQRKKENSYLEIKTYLNSNNKENSPLDFNIR